MARTRPSLTVLPATSELIPVGRLHEPSVVYAVRTPEQRATVLAIRDREDFDFACNNPCDELTAEIRPNYTGRFAMLWVDKAGVLHLARIGTAGNIYRELTGDDAARAKP
jgi:hypothetical protein